MERCGKLATLQNLVIWLCTSKIKSIDIRGWCEAGVKEWNASEHGVFVCDKWSIRPSIHPSMYLLAKCQDNANNNTADNAK